MSRNGIHWSVGGALIVGLISGFSRPMYSAFAAHASAKAMAVAEKDVWEDARYGFWASCANCGKCFYAWVEKGTPILGELHGCGHCSVLLKFKERGYCYTHRDNCQATIVANSK